MFPLFLFFGTAIVGGGYIHSAYEGEVCLFDCEVSEVGQTVTELSFETDISN